MIRTANLTKVYTQGFTEITALKNCNIHIKKGEFVAITGASGSGKSTILHICGGMLKPTDGKIFIDNEDITEIKSEKLAEIKRKKIGFIFQQFNLLPFMTAQENIIIPALMDKNKYDKDYLKDLVYTLKLTQRLEHYPSQLSGGEQQRVAIARALINKPPIILADEPTGNLDKKMSEEFIYLLSVLIKKYEQTVMLVTHDANIAEKADRVICIDDGKIVLGSY